MNASQAFCVLGMHRSGTSLATKLLNLLGVYLGPSGRLVKPRAANTKGFWEHQSFVRINDRILKHSGGNWQQPPDFPDGSVDAAGLEDLKQQAINLIKEDFADAQIWGWKDPRTCLTLPFWQQLVPSLRYIICFRNPIDVARSLKRRDGFSMEKGYYLWLVYLRSALEYTLGQPRIFVFYEDLMENWRFELPRLSGFIGDVERAGRSETKSAVEDFIDERLRHHRSAILDDPKPGDSQAQRLMLNIARQIYENHKQEDFVRQNVLSRMFQQAIETIFPLVREELQESSGAAKKRLQLAADEVTDLINSEELFVLAGEYQWGSGEMVIARRHVPFLERGGQYWGPPADDATAIEALMSVRESGARYFVFRWPSFWWLDYYPEFHAHLRSQFPCVTENDRLIVFDLQPQVSRASGSSS